MSIDIKVVAEVEQAKNNIRRLTEDVSTLQNAEQLYQRALRGRIGVDASVAEKMQASAQRQANAWNSARLQVAALSAQMERMGASNSAFQSLEAALQNYNRTMLSGLRSTTDFAYAQAKLRDAMAAIRREMVANVIPAVGSGGKEVGRFSGLLENLGSTAVLVAGPLSGIGSRIIALSAILGRDTNPLILGVTAAFASFAAVLIHIIPRMSEVIQTLDKMRNSLRYALGDSGQAELAMRKVFDVSQELGINFEQNAVIFSKFAAAARGTSLQGEETMRIFTAFSKAATVLGLSADDTQGIFLALTQMISKGRVQAEELRGQLGERLPGALNIAARALGVTTYQLDQMLKKGEVGIDLLSKMANIFETDFGPQVSGAVDTLSRKINMLSNSLFDMWNRLVQLTGAEGVFKSFIDMLRQGVEATSAVVAPNSSDVFDQAKAQLERMQRVQSRSPSQDMTFTGTIEGLTSGINKLFSGNINDIANIMAAAHREMEDWNDAMLVGVDSSKELEDTLRMVSDITAQLKKDSEHDATTYDRGIKALKGQLEVMRAQTDEQRLAVAIKKAQVDMENKLKLVLLPAQKQQLAAIATELFKGNEAIKQRNEGLQVLLQGVNKTMEVLQQSDKYIENLRRGGIQAYASAEQQAINTALAHEVELLKQLPDLSERERVARLQAAEAAGLFNYQQKEGAKLYYANLSPLEEYNRKLDELQQLEDAGALRAGVFAKQQAVLRAEFEKSDVFVHQITSSFTTFGEKMYDVFKGFKFHSAEFKDALMGITDEIQRMIWKVGVVNPILNQLFGTSKDRPEWGDTAFGKGGAFGGVVGDIWNKIFQPDTASKEVDDMMNNYVNEMGGTLNQGVANTDTVFGRFTSDLGGLFSGITQSLADVGSWFVKTFGEVLNWVVQNTQSSAGGAGGGGGFGGMFASLFGGTETWSSSGGYGYSSASMFSNTSYAGSFASGGSFKVGGTGGTDSKLVAFHATPGERVDIGGAPVSRNGHGGLTINNLDARGVDPGQIDRMVRLIKEIDRSVEIRAINAVQGRRLRTPGMFNGS